MKSRSIIKRLSHWLGIKKQRYEKYRAMKKLWWLARYIDYYCPELDADFKVMYRWCFGPNIYIKVKIPSNKKIGELYIDPKGTFVWKNAKKKAKK